MKKIISSFLILAATILVAGAYAIDLRSFGEMEKISDIIVVATPVSTQNADEHIDLPHNSPPLPAVGMSTEFTVSFVLKGDSSLKKLVVHHYRLPGKDHWPWAGLASFDPNESTRYLLFLQREPDGRYAPFDQHDPAETSMLKLSGTRWDKMQLDDFKNWLEAKNFLNEIPDSSMAVPLPGISSAVIDGGIHYDGALDEAALNGDLEKARALIKANPDQVTHRTRLISKTPLHLAAEFGHKEVAELLLANGADVDAENPESDTPLHIAVAFGHKEVAELLLANKAFVNAKNGYGQTPLHIALARGHNDLAELLRQHGGIE